MSARIIDFPGEWEGQNAPPEFQGEAQLNALHDARQISAAKREADNWVGTMLLGLIASMHTKDLLRLELAIGTHGACNEATAQALALVRLRGRGKEHRELVSAAIDRLEGP